MLQGVLFEMEDGTIAAANETPAGDGKDDKRIVLSTENIQGVYNNDGVTATAKENDMYELQLPGGYASSVFTLNEEIDLANCTRVTFALSEQAGNLNFGLYDKTWYQSDGSHKILEVYGKNADAAEYCVEGFEATENGTVYYTFTLTDEQKARSLAKIAVSSSEAASCVLQGVLFEMEDGTTPVSSNLTKAVDEGNTGVVLPALSSNMNSYYKSTNVTYVSDKTNGIHTVTYPEGWNQIQFTLSKSVNLALYDKVTFTVEDATEDLKFGLHYWDSTNGTTDLWYQEATPDEGGYYTFDLDQTALTKGTVATTISVWSNGKAQTLKFHGVTFEKKSGSTPVTSENETPAVKGTDDKRIVLSSDNVGSVFTNSGVTATLKGSDMYELALPGNYGSAVFTLNTEIDLKNCKRVTFAVSEQTDNLNFNLYDNTWYSSTCEILGAYGKNSGSPEYCVADFPTTANGTVYYTFTLTDEQKARSVAHIGVSSSSEASCVIHGVLFEMEGDGSDTPVSTGSNPVCASQNPLKIKLFKGFIFYCFS